MSNLTGQQFGNYRLTRHLGTGGFGEVYLGSHVHLQREAAIKLLLRLDAREIDQFRKEAQIIANLVHPNIVTLFDYDVVDTTPFIVMMYAAQGTLRSRYQHGSRVPLAEVVKYIAQAAEGLQFAHDRRVIHRDIKPANLLLGPTGDVLLSDFGIAVTWNNTRSVGTQNGSGTPAYMAPEQIQGHPREASDQYSLAITAYEWLSGARPMAGTSLGLGMSQLQHPEIQAPVLQPLLPGLPVQVDAVLQRALASNWQARFPGIREFAQALAKAADGVGQTSNVQSAPSVSPGQASAGVSATMLAQPWQPQTEPVTPPQPKLVLPSLPITDVPQYPAPQTTSGAGYPLYAPPPPQPSSGASYPLYPLPQTTSGASYPLYAPPPPASSYSSANALYSSPTPYALPATPGTAIPYAFPIPPQRPLALPLTRSMKAWKGWLWTLVYTVLLASLSITFSYLVTSYPDASKAPNWVIIVDIVDGILLFITTTTLGGALLGKWRGMLVSCAIVGLTLLRAYQLSPQPFNAGPSIGYLAYLFFPLTAFVTGWIYERRRYASAGLSFLSLLAGNGFFLLLLLLFISIVGPSSSSSTSSSLGGLVLLVAIPLLVIAGIIVGVLLTLVTLILEAIIHKIVARRQKNV